MCGGSQLIVVVVGWLRPAVLRLPYLVFQMKYVIELVSGLKRALC